MQALMEQTALFDLLSLDLAYEAYHERKRMRAMMPKKERAGDFSMREGEDDEEEELLVDLFDDRDAKQADAVDPDVTVDPDAELEALAQDAD